jgi:ubiquinone/menaquinone biosynthesis C-methylase UbiE
MTNTGDTERQAFLRDKSIKQSKEKDKGRYIEKILSVLKPNMKLLDIGCGTGHIIQKLASMCEDAFLVGLDISPAMIEIARKDSASIPNVRFTLGDGMQLPFLACSFDIVINRLAEYSVKETYRAVCEGGHFLEYGLGPEADKEIKESFPDRIDSESFCIPKVMGKWKEEVCREVIDAGFTIENIEDYKEEEHFQNVEELMDTIEMVPLVKDFDRDKDREIVNALAEKYAVGTGISTTWHYYVLKARKRTNSERGNAISERTVHSE